ncbi:MAG TPA: preprotein translocase subunit TatB [Micromonosporaceae bacterium]|nr:preprotein translocase subunit TatB [Micromonosporaceae bacterium]
MFENLNWWEIGALLLIALLIFGDRLPNAIGDGLRMLRNLRNMARNATEDLSRELGTDIQLEDLHPKTLIRKHLLSEEDEAALRKPLQGVYDSVRSELSGVQQDLKQAASAVNVRPSASPAIGKGGGGSSPGAGGDLPAPSFDVDAT